MITAIILKSKLTYRVGKSGVTQIVPVKIEGFLHYEVFKGDQVISRENSELSVCSVRFAPTPGAPVPVCGVPA